MILADAISKRAAERFTDDALLFEKAQEHLFVDDMVSEALGLQVKGEVGEPQAGE